MSGEIKEIPLLEGWAQAVEILMLVIQDGESHAAREEAKDEIRRLARAVDEHQRLGGRFKKEG